MVFAVLPLFITAGLGAPALAVGIVEGVADGSAAVVKLWSGWYSDRIAWRKSLAVGGYGTTVVGLALLIAVTSWPQVIIARALLGPAIALILLAGGHGFRTVFAVALIPGVVAVIFFGILTRDPRHGRGEPVSLRVPLPGS